MQTLTGKTKYSRFCTFVCLMCAATNLSQMPTFVEHGATRMIALPVWLLLAGVCFLMDKRISLGGALPSVCLAGIFLVYFLIKLLFNSDVQRSWLPYPIFLSTFVLLVSLMVGRHLNTQDIKRICDFYAVSGLIVCADVFIKYIWGANLETSLYAYSSKNSVSQILLTAEIIVLLFWFQGKNKWKKLLGIAALALFTWTLIGLKSRASIIMLPVVLLRLLLGKNIPKNLKKLVGVLCLGAAVFLLIGDNFDYFVDNIIYGGRDSTDLNSVSSGRFDQWKEFPSLFVQAPIFGHGFMPKESLIITALLEYGIIGGSVILALAISPLVWGFGKLSKEHEMYLLFTSLALCYAVNGIFEQLAPFGPGVKCYFLWFLFGILTARPENRLSEQERAEKGMIE